MPVELRDEQRAVRLDTRRLRRQAESLLAAVGRADSVLSILLTDDRRMAPLHERWMGEEGPTDVMSFPMSEGGEECPKVERPLLGDIVISAETAARRRPKDPQGEVLRYLVHGLLHLTGHDHRGKAGRLRMDRKARLLQGRVRAA
jgi:probable rRNA maturation factor